MNPLLVFASVTALIFTYRFAGFAVNICRLSLFWERFLRFVPISVFAALVVSSLYKDNQTLGVKLVALAVAGMVMWRTRQLWLSILIGLGTLWLLTWLVAQ